MKSSSSVMSDYKSINSGYESEDDTLQLHEAKYTTDNKGYVFERKALDLLKIGDIVRISFKANTNYKWTHDSPYMKIIEFTRDMDILGDVQRTNRYNSDLYPVQIGDKIWFKQENIIEIPLDVAPNYSNANKFKKYLTAKRLMCTGPLFTVFDSDDDSDSDSDDESDEKKNDSDVSDE